MTRLEWTRFEGNDTEAVVAMCINREHPNSVRITPSRGDGGIDILDRGAAADGGDVVYQVKRHTDPLSTKQKNDAEESLLRLKSDPRWGQLNVTTWYLVTPWDPTPEADLWLQQIASQHSLTATWRGLTHVEALATKYPEVIDYYLHGGRDRIEEAYQTAMALMGLGNGHNSLDVPATVERVKLAVRALDTDPHYRYELRFGEGEFAAAASRPGLVMTQFSGTEDNGPWTAVDIIARCAASVDERPISISGAFTVTAGSDFEAAMKDFFAYGTSFTSPEGAYAGTIDAPGGLGGPLENAQVFTFPLNDDLGVNPNVHVQIIDPDGNVLASADLDRIERSRGSKGVRTVHKEIHRVFTVEDRFDVASTGSTRSLRFGDFAGQPVDAVLNAFKFVAHCQAPNVGRRSIRGTPPQLGRVDTNWAFAFPQDAQQMLDVTVQMLEHLATVQAHSSALVRVPDFDALSEDQARSWAVAARLLEGEDVWFTYPDGDPLFVGLEPNIIYTDGPLSVMSPFIVEIGEQKIDFGHLEMWLDEPTIVDSRESDGQTIYAVTTPGRKARYHRAGDTSIAPN
jgi:hypothetical protein